MVNSIFAIIPPILALTMVLLTKRVLLSLGVGIGAGAILLAMDSQEGLVPVIKETFVILYETVKGIFFDGNALNTGNLFILLFLIFLGMITAFITMSGGSKAFGEWAVKRVTTRSGAQLVVALMGIILFIDDYFNALAVGQIARPITDRKKVSRAKLAYIIDSTSAPVCVVSPISSWGAYIIALLVSIFAANGITEITAFSAFIQMMPMNLYVWCTLFLVFASILWKMNFGPMQAHEDRAERFAILRDPEKTAPGDLQADLPVSETGKVSDLMVPIIALFIGTVGAMLWTGHEAAGSGADLLTIFENTDVSRSLFIGGSIGLVTAIFTFLRNRKLENNFDRTAFFLGLKEGTKSMLPAITILLFAWGLSSLITDLQTGVYLAGLIQEANFNIGWLPALLFTIAAIMSFATGSSWGSFGILLPIAGTIAATTDESILLAGMAAVFAGAVFGDHCSPISDTTILSATGAGCNHIDHVVTQIPYALVAAVSAAVGYMVIGFIGMTLPGLIVSLVLTFVIGTIASKKSSVVANVEELNETL